MAIAWMIVLGFYYWVMQYSVSLAETAAATVLCCVSRNIEFIPWSFR